MAAFKVTTTGYPAATITAGGLPSGLGIASTGSGKASITGTPAPGTSGVYTVTITAIGSGSPATQQVTLTVDQAPTITSAASLTITRGVLMTPFSVTTTGYPAATLTASGLPGGVSILSNGNGTATISGNPLTTDTAKTYRVTIHAANGATPNATQAFSLTLNP